MNTFILRNLNTKLAKSDKSAINTFEKITYELQSSFSKVVLTTSQTYTNSTEFRILSRKIRADFSNITKSLVTAIESDRKTTDNKNQNSEWLIFVIQFIKSTCETNKALVNYEGLNYHNHQEYHQIITALIIVIDDIDTFLTKIYQELD